MAKEIFCYFHFGGEMIKDFNGSTHYEGGKSTGSLIKEGTSLEELLILLDLIDDGGVENLIKFNDNFAHVYIIGKGHESSVAAIESHQGMEHSILDSYFVSSSSHEIEQLPCAISCVPSLSPAVNASKWEDLLVGTGQIFPNADALRQAIYKYSLAHKFDYVFPRNSPDKVIVKCKVEGCKWKLTAYAFDKNSSFLSVRTFHKEHIHSAQDNLIVSHNPRCTLTSSIIIDGVRSSVDKTPNEIRKDLFREYGLSLTYRQALRAKEKALEEIHGLPEQSYMLIPWLCNRMMEKDPETVAMWVASENNRFERLFIAYGCCIKGFLVGARPIICVDGSHLSGPYRGTVLAASAYDANNNLFPLAYAIVGAETYDNWSWFLQKVKEITDSVPVTIISDRNNGIILAVRAIYGGDKHAYCYRHVKENFSSQFNKVCTGMGRKSKEDALKLLDAIAYA